MEPVILRGEPPQAASRDGSGYGSGDGYGSGYGSGYGDGYGDGSEEYWKSTIQYFAAKWPDERRERFHALVASGATIAFWRSDSDGRACNGGHHTEPVKPGTVERIAGPLVICTANALHATLLPPKWEGSRWWIVALIGEVQQRDDKFGALEREVIGEAL